MKADFLTSLEACDTTCLDKWRALAQAESRDGFFRSPDWYQTWLRQIRVGAEPLLGVVRNGQQAIVGIAPLCRIQRSYSGLRANVIQFGGGDIVAGDFLGVLAANGQTQSVNDAVLEAIPDLEWDVFSANEIVLGSPLHIAIERFARKQRLHVRRTDFRVCPFLSLPSNFDDYLKGVSKTLRYNFRRGTKELEALGARVEIFKEPAEIGKRIPELVRLSATRWEAKGKTSSLQQGGVTGFLSELAAVAEPSVQLYQIVEREGKTAAMLLVFYNGESVLYYQGGFDPSSELARFSPGVVLIGTAVREAIERGVRYFDFLRGDESYKTDWTDEARVTTTLQIARGRAGRMWLAAMHGRESAKIIMKTQP